jgi:hypothetical protein
MKINRSNDASCCLGVSPGSATQALESLEFPSPTQDSVGGERVFQLPLPGVGTPGYQPSPFQGGRVPFQTDSQSASFNLPVAYERHPNSESYLCHQTPTPPGPDSGTRPKLSPVPVPAAASTPPEPPESQGILRIATGDNAHTILAWPCHVFVLFWLHPWVFARFLPFIRCNHLDVAGVAEIFFRRNGSLDTYRPLRAQTDKNVSF